MELSRSGSWLALLVVSAAACGEAPAPLPLPEVVETSVDGARNGVSPTAPVTVVFSLAPDALDLTSLMVVRGVADDRFVAAANKPPLNVDRQARLAPGLVFLEGRVARFVPSLPLEPLALHTLLVTRGVESDGVRMARAEVRAFTTGDASVGAPVAWLDAPTDGSSGVVRNLREVEVRFTEAVSNVDATSLLLVGDEGAAPATVVPANCRFCYRVVLALPLVAGQHYRLLAGPPIADAAGTPPFVWKEPPGFTAGSEIRGQPPALDALSATSSSGCLVARWRTDVAASSRLCVGTSCVEERALVTIHELGLEIGTGGAGPLVVASRDESTQPEAVAGPVDAPASSPRQLVITEVLTRPRGMWPAQQFVELWNHGPTDETLDGLELHDERGSNPLPAVVVPAGGYALVVPSTYVLDDGLDPVPPDGTVIARVERARLGKNGLKVGGAAVAILEADGRAVSRFSTYGMTLDRGQSARRVAVCDLASAYQPSPGGGSSPGLP